MSVRVTTLPNGMRVASDPMPNVETASIGAWVAAGTRHERPELNGIAHLLEHMAFKGTARRSARQIAEQIEAVGGHLNAFTAREQTCYYAKVLKEDVALAVDILADILQHSQLDADELARERSVVAQEIGQAWDTPDDIIFDHFQATAFPGQAIGRPVLGTVDTVELLSREALSGFMAEHYAAPNLVLAAAGNIDHDSLVALAAEQFAELPPPAGRALAPAEYRGGEYGEARDLEQVHLVMGFAGVSHVDPDFYALSVYSTLLGGGMSSRLFQEVREKRGLAYSVYSFSSSYADGGLFGVYAGTSEADADEALRVICDEIARVPESVPEDELARARAQLKAGLLMSLESTGSRSEALGQQLLIFGRPIPVAELVDKIAAVDAAAIARVAGRLTASAPTFATLGPAGRIDSFASIARRLAA